MNDDEYSMSPADRLAFSADTVSFDTVFSGQPTTTSSFEVYNPTRKSIRLKNVYLEREGNSVFRVNVDGVFLETDVCRARRWKFLQGIPYAFCHGEHR